MPQHARALLMALMEATLTRQGGEVVVRHGNETGRIFFHLGKVAWVVASTVPKTLLSFLVDHSSLTSEELQEVFEECRRSGANFGETIVQWGLLDRETIRNLLLGHISTCFREILLWPNVETVFIPKNRTYEGSLTFDLAELLRATAELDHGEAMPVDVTRLGEIAQELLRKRGAGTKQEVVERPNGASGRVEKPHPVVPSRGCAEANGRGGERTGAKILVDKLAELNHLDGFVGAGLFSGQGVLIATGLGSRLEMDVIGALMNNLVINARKATQRLGFGLSDAMDIVTEEGAYIFVRCHGDGATGVILIVVCSKDARAGMVQFRVGQMMTSLIKTVCPAS